MHRFFLDKFEQNNGEIKIFDEEQIHQIKDVLRLKPGDEFVCFNTKGQQFLVILEQYQDNFIIGKIIQEISAKGGSASGGKNNPEVKIKINLSQSLLKADKFEWLIKEGTALGIDQFTPLITERSIVQHISEQKLTRWRKIAQEATEQSGRVKIPTVASPIDFKNIKINAVALNLVAHEKAKKSLKQVLPKRLPEQINLFIGPEGGFSEAEIQRIEKMGGQSFIFGPRILRAEFAGLSIISAIFYHCGEL